MAPSRASPPQLSACFLALSALLQSEKVHRGKLKEASAGARRLCQADSDKLREFEETGRRVLEELSEAALKDLEGAAVVLESLMAVQEKARQLMDEGRSSDGDSETDAEEVLLEGWETAICPDSGDTYYFNRASGEVSWDKPAKPRRRGRRSGDREKEDLQEEIDLLQDCVVVDKQDSFATAGVNAIFQQYDTDESGFITRDDLAEVFSRLGMGDTFSKDEVNVIVNAADTNGDGVIDIQEFTNWLYTTGENVGTMFPPSKKTQCLKTLCPIEMKAVRKELASTKSALAAAEGLIAAGQLALQQAELRMEEEMDSSVKFWRTMLESSSVQRTLDAKLDTSAKELLGNGKYGFVFKCRRRAEEGGAEVVVKLLSIRWAHVAVKEYQSGTMMGGHPNIVSYENVLVHADSDKSIEEFLKMGLESGKVHCRTKRKKFPDRYICFVMEFMNCGTVQDWIDESILLPGGIFRTMQSVANALAFMHSKGVTHNDIKPENVMLQRQGPASAMVIKLGDLGLAAKSPDISADHTQYGLTVLCMFTGEKFGSRKFNASRIEEFVEELTDLGKAFVKDKQPAGDIASMIFEVPALLRRIWTRELPFAELGYWPSLVGWDFFAGGEGVDISLAAKGLRADTPVHPNFQNHKLTTMVLPVDEEEEAKRRAASNDLPESPKQQEGNAASMKRRTSSVNLRYSADEQQLAKMSRKSLSAVLADVGAVVPEHERAD